MKTYGKEQTSQFGGPEDPFGMSLLTHLNHQKQSAHLLLKTTWPWKWHLNNNADPLETDDEREPGENETDGNVDLITCFPRQYDEVEDIK